MKLMVSLIRQLQLIGIKTNLESFAITILMEHMLTRNQLPLFLLASKQWGMNRTNGIYSFPIPFTEALCCFGGGGAGSGYYDNASAYSNTQVYVYSDGSSRFVSWIAIGV